MKKKCATPSSAAACVAADLVSQFMSLRNAEQAAHLARFFKTGPGQYGEGDKFLGIKVPVTRALVKQYAAELTPAVYALLTASEWHEIRLAGFLLMVRHAAQAEKKKDLKTLRFIVTLYDKHLERANNWELIDLSVRDIMGSYWRCSGEGRTTRKQFLEQWAGSGKLWRERAAIVATYATIRLGSLDETFWLAQYFINHPHDLIHKAIGWMLREAGKFSRDALRAFLAEYHTRLPRTALRYAIEHMDESERKQWMARPVTTPGPARRALRQLTGNRSAHPAVPRRGKGKN